MARKATKDDLCGILALYKYLLPEEDFSDAEPYLPCWNEILQHNGLTYFVALDGCEIVATCNIIIVPNMTHGRRPYAFIENVVTHPDMRRKGYGRKVVQRAIDHAKSQNCYKILLLSSINRKNAHDFYTNIGFDGDSKRGFQIRIS
jgi:GNAT superfamily N-acetyltransferase